MSDERRLQSVHMGRMAEVALEHVLPLLQKEEQEALTQLRHAFRGGLKDQNVITAQLARLCVVEDLYSKMKAQLSASYRAKKELENEPD